MRYALKKLRFPCLLLLTLALLASGLPVFAAEGETLLTAVYDESVMGRDLSWQFPFSDGMFAHPATEYDHALARASLGLALSSFRILREFDPFDGRSGNAYDYLEQAGFRHFSDRDYDQTPSLQTVSTMICCKEMEDGEGPFTLIAVGVSGGGYEMEWLSNFTVGSGVRHEGFARAAANVEGRILWYIAENGLEGRLKLWTAGFSRAGAISNLVAADMDDFGPFGKENIFAYTFAAPRNDCLASERGYENIFNILGKMDVMPQVPLAAWGYGRYGVDLCTPARETDPDYAERLARADAVYHELTGLHYESNPETNRTLRSLLEYMGDICPTADDYVNHMQETVKHMMEHPNMLSIAVDFARLAGDRELITEENRETANELMNFILSVAWDVLTRSGSIQKAWNDEGGLFFNLFREHTPAVYLSWLFSSDDPAEVYSDAQRFRRVVVEGEVSLSLYDENGLVQTLRADGSLEPAPQRAETPDVFMARVNKQSVAILPARSQLYLTGEGGGGPVTVYCVSYDLRAPSERSGWSLSLTGAEAERFRVDPDGNAANPAGYKRFDRADLTARLQSETGMLERIERMNVFRLSWMTILNIAAALPLLVLLLLLFLIVRAAARRRKRKKAANV